QEIKEDKEKTIVKSAEIINLFDNKKSEKKNSLCRLAITGMEAIFGSSQGLNEFHRTVYEGLQHFKPLPKERWKGLDQYESILKKYGFNDGKAPMGAYLEKFDIDFLGFKIPPNKDDRLIPQQLLALKVADNAIKSSRLKEGTNTAVLVAMGAELSLHRFRGRVNLSTQLDESFNLKVTRENGYQGLDKNEKDALKESIKDSVHGVSKVNQYTSFIGNIMASRISSVWDFSGPSFSVSSEENSVFKALDMAQLMLSAKEVDAVVIAAVDLSGGVENVLLRNSRNRINSGTPTLSFDENVNGWMVGEGAGAIVLKRHDRAVKDNDRIYAVLNAIAFSAGVDKKAVASVCRKAARTAGINLGDIEYLEVFASGLKDQDDAEIKGLINAYGFDENHGSCALGSIKSNIGHTYAASGMAGVIKTALCLYNRFFPGTPGWSKPRMQELWKKSPFFIPSDSRTWFNESKKESRMAAINGMGSDGTSAHVILSEERGQTREKNEYLAALPLSLFLLTGNTIDDLLKELGELTESLLTIKESKGLAKVASKFFRKFSEKAEYKFRAAIIGQKRGELFDEIDLAKGEIRKAAEKGVSFSWSSEKGSYFTSEPLGETGKVTFVYPGGYNSYIELGRNLFQLFPEIYENMGAYSDLMVEMSGNDLIYPKSMTRLSESEFIEKSEKLFNHPSVMFESGIMSSVLYTDIARESFKIKPDQALGYSMGEVSMLIALGVWKNLDSFRKKMHRSNIFHSRVSESMKNIIKAWDIKPEEAENEKIWFSYKLKASPLDVRSALKKDREISKGREASLIFVNTPEEVIISGYDKACRRVINDLGCPYSEVPVTDIIHSEIIRPNYEELVNLHRNPVTVVEDIDFYSAFNFARVVMDSDLIAENVANVYSKEIDFEKLIETSYQDNGRIFIELGPKNNCSCWIDEILKDKKHLAVSFNQKDRSENLTIIQSLAKLFCHRVDMDLSPLYTSKKLKQVSKKLLVKSISLGGVDIDSSINSEKNREYLCRNLKKDIFPEKDILPRKGIFAKKESSVQSIIEPKINREKSSPMHKSENRPPLEKSDLQVPCDLQVMNNASLLNTAHKVFLKTRERGTKELKELITMQIALLSGQVEPGTSAAVKPETTAAVEPGTIIWDDKDLLEFAEGSIAKVFGEDYGIIDTYKRRVRLPMEEYLLVSRVTELDAVKGEFKPSKMTTEYDIPFDSPMTIDGQIPWAIAVESGQCDLLLISYIGIDFDCKGERVYRLLDCSLTFMDEIAMEGETLRYDIRINSYAKSGEGLLFFFSYRCFAGDRLLLKMDGGCAGFFTDEELDAGKGITHTDEELEIRKKIEKKSFKPLLFCNKSSFNKDDMMNLVKGEFDACFGDNYDQNGLNPSLRFASNKMLMIDSVNNVDINGGAWGLGSVEGKKILDPDHWYFPCHFKGDQVMAGSLMAEGCGQLLQFFLLYIGMHTKTMDARFQPIIDLPQKVRCRGQVTPQHGELVYRLEVKEIGLDPEPYAIADIDIILNGRIVVDFKDLGVRIVEKKKNDPFALSSDTINEIIKKRENAEAGPKAKAENENENKAKAKFLKADKALYSQYHLQHFAKGKISECFGPDFKIYDDRTAPRTPNGDLQLTTRVIEVNGKKNDFSSPAYCVAEYEVPQDAWYYKNNSHPGVMPYSIIMEIALQPCGFISACMGTTLISPDTDFYFRNLDGEGTILRDIDLRGKTIVNKSTLLNTMSLGNTIIQTFEFNMKVDDKDYYNGTASFGYFVASALQDQVGLDNGIDNHPMTEKKYLKNQDIINIDLKSAGAEEKFYKTKPEKPHYRLTDPQLDFLSKVQIVKKGGEEGLGYVYADRPINRADWFFDCHFFEDPVMPGSLGVESVIQALQVFALEEDLGAQFKSPRFTQIEDQIIWKYRGQINPEIDKMAIEVHITEIKKSNEKVVVKGKASLWKDKIRIYEVKQIALVIEES
ncbi:MAG: beta-ketoacyl synthase N-terminal-like domain-containing protein, partial [Thermodesulfobacteriota bacterium]|nr:beta-ketoacyl synthase N-terminal-like domain-containing protein [Thermodesulfobacteriota bacterium]